MKHSFLVLGLLCTYLTTNAQFFNDCETPFPICEMKTYHFGFLEGHGKIKEAFSRSECFQASTAAETNSIWLEWNILEEGSLIFTISPERETDDLDFILYLAGSNCEEKTEVRCMASGSNLSGNRDDYNCLGSTGLSFKSLDEFESQGCKYSDDNYLKFLSAKRGEKYLLLVNNYDSNSGFSLSLEGDCVFAPQSNCEFINTSEDLMITSLYPNPVSDVLNIEYVSLKDKGCKFSLHDIKGQVLLSKEITSRLGLNHELINTEHLAVGTYIIKIVSDGYSTVKQFVKN